MECISMAATKEEMKVHVRNILYLAIRGHKNGTIAIKSHIRANAILHG